MINKDLFKILIVLIIGIPVHLSAQIILNSSDSNLGMDHLFNRYQISNHLLVKIVKSDTLVFQNRMLGPIHSVDISNPLRLLLFYKESNTVLFLDNTLSPISEPILLDPMNVIEASAVCNATTNGFWLFNVNRQRIEQYDSQLKLCHQSANLSKFELKKYSLHILQSSGAYTFLNDPNKGLLQFDRFGLYIKTLPILNIEHFDIMEK